ncbi:zinc finger protein 879-like isoform X3 [Maniola hyperantus]|uniref:zinc finger protein 879-like isoform X3 n=1 Tax=Aphantopus hyperantus TaxID=2795564 RepID=UPI00374A4CEA
MRCCVPFCKTTAEVVTESEIKFHEFPREVHLHAAWLRALGKQHTPLPERAVVCSQHFLNDDMYEIESGSRRIRAGAVPSPVLVCMICLDTRSKLVLMSKYKLEEAYEHLVGHPLCGEGKLKPTLCVQCAQRLVNFSTFRDKSLRARSLMMELLDRHEVITIRHVKLISRVKYQLQSDIVSAVSEPDYCDVYIAHSDADGRTELDATAATDEAVAVKREVEDREDDEDEPAAAERATETQAPAAHIICKPESSEVYDQALVAPSVLATDHGNEEHPTDADDELDILSFENNTNIFEYSRKSQDSVLKLKESLAKISDNINSRITRQNKHNSQDISDTQLGNYTDQIQYICDVCQKIFQRKSSLVTHIRAHTYANTFSCKLRERKFGQSSTSSSPRRTHTGEKPFACKLCKYKCTVNSSLVKHMRTHSGEKPFVCKLCKYKCSESGSLLKHMRTHTGEKPFACKLCKYKCTVNSSLVKHMRTHSGEKPFACKLCKYKCSESGSLVKHMRTHTGEKPFVCKLCNYKFTVNSNLLTHMRTHTGEKPFVCKLCNYKCTMNGSLVSHMRTHTGEKPFVCKLCNYKCTVNSHLVIHMRTHSGEKPFVCKLCNYKCTVNGSLVSHMRTHTGEKPFVCKLCKYKCSKSGSLVKHMRTHTGEKPFVCKLCNYQCTQNINLVRHMKTHTG